MSDAIFNKSRHIKYYLRCLKTFLPDLYTPNDSNRMLLAFFTVAGLDVLDALHTETTPEERKGYIEWIYHCQVPSGGFRGFTGTDFGLERRTSENAIWDPASIPSTFFALVILIILGDDLSRVKRSECLRWLPRLQREDGSFGDISGSNGEIEGGRDLRFCCCAAGTRYILRGIRGEGLEEDIQDIDVPGLVAFIEACQTYDGGMSAAPFCESHSGLTYCAIGALTFLSQLATDTKSVPLLTPGTEKFESLVRWLVERQTSDLGEEDSDDEQATGSHEAQMSLPRAVQGLQLGEQLDALPPNEAPSEASLQWAGFNGRSNKVADTCYSFWNTATLAMMNRLDLVDGARNRRYLVEKTQHLVGGFGKGVGEPPDLLHSYFGLVSMAFAGEPGLNSVDPSLCSTHRSVQHLHSLTWWQGDRPAES